MRSEQSTPPPIALPWMARMLPRQAREDWFAPALADLRAESRERRQDATSARRRAVVSAWFAGSAAWLFLETLRLATQQGIRSLFERPPQEIAPRKDWTAMLFRDVRGALRIFRREPAFA